MKTRKPAHVVIAEDNAVGREVLRGVIMREEAFKLVGEAVNGHVALELVKSLRPDLVCLDVMMPGLDGLSVMRAINDECPETRVVLVTGHATSEVVNEALAQGASGLVVKPYSAQKLLLALHGALRKPARTKPQAMQAADTAAAEPVVIPLSTEEPGRAVVSPDIGGKP